MTIGSAAMRVFREGSLTSVRAASGASTERSLRSQLATLRHYLPVPFKNSTMMPMSGLR